MRFVGLMGGGACLVFFFFFLVLLAGGAVQAQGQAARGEGEGYAVKCTRTGMLPVVAALGAARGAPGSSVLDWNYNAAAYATASDVSLLVRAQNHSDDGEYYDVGPSVMAYTTAATTTGHWSKDTVFSPITEENVVFSPQESWENYGTEDPRIVWDDATELFYLFYSAVEQTEDGSVTSRLSLATTKDASSADGWTRYGPLFPEEGWSKSGALLLRTPEEAAANPNGIRGYLIFGDSDHYPGLQVATTTDLIHYDIIPDFLLIETREDHFDSVLVEAGPPPLRLKDGNWLLIYNSAQDIGETEKPGYTYQYNVGYAILDGADPTKVLQRSEEPIFSPDLAWESGEGMPEPVLTPYVVFIEGMVNAPASTSSNREDVDTFTAWYGAADSYVGQAKITVTHA